MASSQRAGCVVFSASHLANRVQRSGRNLERSNVHRRCQILCRTGCSNDHDVAIMFIAHGMPPVVVSGWRIRLIRHGTYYRYFSPDPNGNQSLSTFRRFSHPPQGRTPTAFVSFARLSPRPRDLPTWYICPHEQVNGKSSGPRFAVSPHLSHVHMVTHSAP